MEISKTLDASQDKVNNSVGGFRKYRKLNLLKVVERTSFT
jgi:hypothetical protein